MISEDDLSGVESAQITWAALKAALDRDPVDEAETDLRYELITEIHEWAVAQSATNERHSAYVVVLGQRLRDQDADDMVRLLCRIAGISSVVPILGPDWETQIGIQKERAKIATTLRDLAYLVQNGSVE